MKIVNTSAPATPTAMAARTRMTIRFDLLAAGGIHPSMGSDAGAGAGGIHPGAGSVSGRRNRRHRLRRLRGLGLMWRIPRRFVHDPSCAPSASVVVCLHNAVSR